MAWITTKDGRHVNTDWFDKDKQIADNKKEADSRTAKDNSTGTGSVSYKNGLARAKRNATQEKYSFNETILDAAYEHNLNADEVKALSISLWKYCDKNNLYGREIHDYYHQGETVDEWWDRTGKRILDML